MKKLTIISILAITAVVSACDKPELRVDNWGPQSTRIGTNPNKQPDGSMGIWIEVSGTQGLGEAQVLFSGKPAKATSIQEKLITAAIPTEQLAELGDKEVSIKQMATNKVYSVGVFKVVAAK